MKTALQQVHNERGSLFCGEDGDSYSREELEVVAEAQTMDDAKKFRAMLAHDQKLTTSKLENSVKRIFYQEFFESKSIRIREAVVRGLGLKILKTKESDAPLKICMSLHVTNPSLENLSEHVQDAVAGAFCEYNVIIKSIKVVTSNTLVVKFVQSANENHVSHTIPARRRLTLQELMDLKEAKAAKLFIEEVMMAYNYTGPMFQASYSDKYASSST
jgi:hypothetical protein